jgi:hypothetical protein
MDAAQANRAECPSPPRDPSFRMCRVRDHHHPHATRPRKKRLGSLLSKRRVGIVLSTHTDEDGAAGFRQACAMGLEGIVSKRLSATL